MATKRKRNEPARKLNAGELAEAGEIVGQLWRAAAYPEPEVAQKALAALRLARAHLRGIADADVPTRRVSRAASLIKQALAAASKLPTDGMRHVAAAIAHEENALAETRGDALHGTTPESWERALRSAQRAQDGVPYAAIFRLLKDAGLTRASNVANLKRAHKLATKKSEG